MSKYLLKNRLLLILVVIVLILNACGEVIKAKMMGNLLEGAVNRENFQITTLCIYTVFTILFIVFISILKEYISSQFISYHSRKMKEDWMRVVLRKDINDFRKRDSSVYLSNFTTDITMFQEEYFEAFLLMLEYTISFIASIIYIYRINGYFILFVAVTCWIPGGISLAFKKRLFRVKKKFSEQNQIFISKTQEIFDTFEIIQHYLVKNILESRWRNVNRETENSRAYKRFTGGFCESLAFGGSLFVWFGNLLFGVILSLSGKIQLGQILEANQLLNNVVNPLYRVTTLYTKMKSSENLYLELKKTYQGDLMDSELEKSVELMETAENLMTPSLKEKLEINHLNVNIGDKQILSDININFEKGKKYVIVGKSGSGKTTFIKSLMGYYSDINGSIKIDGKEKDDYTEMQWYSMFTMIYQVTVLLNDTILNNITLYKDYTKDEVEHVIQTTNLAEVIQKLPDGLDTIVEENGKNFSGGEGQRLAIARALIRNPEIILVDEATSALDPFLTGEIEHLLLGLEGKTVISITHKLNLEILRQYDEVILFENGKLVEHGNCEILMQGNSRLKGLLE